MVAYQSIDQLSRKARVTWAVIIVALGLLAIFTAAGTDPGSRVAIALSGGAFVFAGLSVATYSTQDPRAYHWLIALTLGCMLGILVWLTFGDGDRSCGFPLPLWGQDVPCRVIASISATVIGLVLAIAVKQALKARKAAP